ncbi:MAG: maleylacetoacetate isomerase [Telluria sp.]
MLKLYDYPRSSAAYRVRIALALKGLSYEKTDVHLLRDGGEQHGSAYRAINPQGLVPALEIDGTVLTQSMAIIEYLDERFPTRPLLPRDPLARARVRAMALMIGADIHPIQNLRVGNYLRAHYGQDDAGVAAWNRHWTGSGLKSFQDFVERDYVGSRYCCGDEVSLADVMLVPQMANARRQNVDLGPLARLVAIDAALRALPAFAAAAPPSQ